MSRLVPSTEQQRILDHGLRPMRIRAGAGTGKTTTVAMVISNLVGNLGVEPEQILGITFTNKAAAELADRVRMLLGPEVDWGRQVEVHTYHGFAGQVLSEFGALAGVDTRAKVITPTFARQLLGETFWNQPYRFLDITQPRTLDRLRRLRDRLGDHLLDPSDLMAAMQGNEDEVWGARAEMADTLERYDEDKRRLGVVDYSDLVTLSVRILSTYPELAHTIRDRYCAVVLDEYQDTNPAQRVMLTCIFDGGFPVIAVGDEDQTIYEWRGASPENFELFPSHFPDVEGEAALDEDLTLNRRSCPDILAVANEVRSRANPSADDLAPLHGEMAGEVVTRWAEDALAESEWIARSFERLHDDGVPWAEMAVLFRKNKDFPPVVDALSRHDIPVEVANIGGLFSVPEVADLRAWLTILDRPEDSAAITQILVGSRYRLGLADLAPLSRWISSSADATDEEHPMPVTLIEAIEAADEIPDLRPGAKLALGRFLDVYRSVLPESQGLTLVETCRTILDRTRTWQDLEALPPNLRLTARLNIYRLLDLAEDWSPLKGRPSLGAFLEHLEAMQEEPAEELDSAHLSGEDAVTLVTVHRAKGLEWDTVAIPAVTKWNFPARAQQHPDPIRFAEHLPIGLRIDSAWDDLPADEEERKQYLRRRHETQEWRVAYVAVTRAKSRLLISGAYWYGLPEPSLKPAEPSELYEVVAAHPLTVNTQPPGRAGPRPALLASPGRSAAPDPVFADGWAAALGSILRGDLIPRDRAKELGLGDDYENAMEEMSERLFRLAEPSESAPDRDEQTVSVTSLVTYAQCPKRFYWNEVDPLPRKPNPAATRGTEVHRRIELHQRGQVPLDELFEDTYDRAEGEEEGASAKGAYASYLSSRYAQRRAALVEAPFTILTDTGYRVRGRIDAVYCQGSRWEVVDFKSGTPSEDPSRVVQLQAYAVAASQVDFGLARPTELEVMFAYLGDGVTEISFHADPPWVAAAVEALSQLTEGIQRGAYEEKPGKWCSGCDFLRFCGPGRSHIGA